MYLDSQMLYLLKSINNRLCCTTGGGTTTPTEITFAPSTAQDGFGRLRVSEPFTLFDSSHRYDDNDLWATNTTGNGAAIFNADQGLVDLNVTGTSGSSVIRETIKVFPYQPGKSLLILSTFVLSPVRSGLLQRVGYFGDNNGFYFEISSDGTQSFVKRSLVTGSTVDTPVPQQNWNGDKLDGTGPSGIVLDTTKAQILWIDLEWLGVGSVRMGFVIDGQFILCHTFQHANIIESTYITTASLPIRYEITNVPLVNTVPTTLKQICSTVISEGGYELRGAQLSAGTTITAPRTFAVAGTYYPIMSIRLKSTRLDAIVIPTAVSLLGLGNGKNYQWRILNGGVTTTGGSWLTAAADSSVEYNITATAASGGRVLASGFINSSNQGSPYLSVLKEALFTNQLERNSFTGTAYEFVVEMAVSTTSGGEGAYASIDWEEISR